MPICPCAALVGELVTKHGQAFKTNYTVKRGFHVTLTIPNRTVTFDFPAEVEVVSIHTLSHIQISNQSNQSNKIQELLLLSLTLSTRIQLEIKRNTCYLTTSEVNKLNIRIQNVIEEIIIQSNV